MPVTVVQMQPGRIARELTDRALGAPYQLETMFGGSLGRLFVAHEGDVSTQPRLMFANEALRSAATQQIGPHRMATYAEILARTPQL